jgi:hypothetical protein
VAWDHIRDVPSARYSATPADELFALGVTAYRLVTDEYPPSTAPEEDTEGVWRMDSKGPRTPVALNYRVERRLSALIMKMLSVQPEKLHAYFRCAGPLHRGPPVDR